MRRWRALGPRNVALPCGGGRGGWARGPRWYAWGMRGFPAGAVVLLGLVSALGLAGCHSAYVNAVVENRTPQPISLVELDYPSASFGTQTLAPGANYAYRFKVLGTGATKLLWTDAAHKEQKSDGPELKEGDEGSLVVVVGAGGVKWGPKLVVK